MTSTPVTPRVPVPQTPTLRTAARVFVRQPSPALLVLATAVLVVARLAVGAWAWTDLVVAAALVLAQPVIEWLIHVHLLHVEPRGPVGRAADAAAGRSHRQHHADPHDLTHVFVHPYLTRSVLVLAIVLGVLVVPAAPRTGTGLLAATALLLTYEWTHFLIHSTYEARGAVLRRLRQGHALHHFRNESYWFGVVSPFGDRLLGTAPDKLDVAVSPTAASAQARVRD